MPHLLPFPPTPTPWAPPLYPQVEIGPFSLSLSLWCQAGRKLLGFSNPSPFRTGQACSAVPEMMLSDAHTCWRRCVHLRTLPQVPVSSQVPCLTPGSLSRPRSPVSPQVPCHTPPPLSHPRPLSGPRSLSRPRSPVSPHLLCLAPGPHLAPGPLTHLRSPDSPQVPCHTPCPLSCPRDQPGPCSWKGRRTHPAVTAALPAAACSPLPLLSGCPS